MKGILVFVAGMILLISAGGRVTGSQPEVGTAQDLKQQILSAAVLITITTPNWEEKAQAMDEALPIPNDEYRAMARAEGEVVADGLGTLVANGNELFLVTHDHWSRLVDALGTVTFHTADGVWLADVDLHDFKEHIRTRDGGTMVVSAPDALKSAVSIDAAAAQPGDLQPGDRGFVVRHSAGSIVVSEVRLIGQGEKLGRPVVQLQNVDGQAITGGDSGGGVWFNGRLAAVMWATVLMENSTTGAQRATDTSLAAIYQGLPE